MGEKSQTITKWDGDKLRDDVENTRSSGWHDKRVLLRPALYPRMGKPCMWTPLAQTDPMS